MRLRVIEGRSFVTGCHARIPFRFGVATMTWAPLLTFALETETEGGSRSRGYASDLLVPKWFDKRPATTARQDAEALLDSVDAALEVALGSAGRETPFDLWWRIYAARVGAVPAGAPDRLVRGFGVSIVERAAIDAACRAAGAPFAGALREDVLGFDAGRIDASLAGWRLGSRNRSAVAELDVRHTVGLADPLVAGDPHSAGVDDGLPVTLEQDVARYGLRFFKLKLSGDAAGDVERLDRIADVLMRTAGEAVRVTLDGNEQFEDLDALERLLERVGSSPRGRWLLARLLLIEQPLHRDATFVAERVAAMPRVAARAPVIIDEADHGLEALPAAAALGYGGVSVKACKGVFRALVNAARCERSGGALIQSAEDLTTLPIVALHQDLATVAALGLGHVERNGHHYFRGLDHVPAAERDAAMQNHGDLYESWGGGLRLAIAGGRLRVASLETPGFGYAGPVDLDARTPRAEWSWPERASDPEAARSG